MYIITIGEIFLKGKNRYKFESKLLHNIRVALKLERQELKILRNRYIILRDNVDELRYVFGVNSYYKVQESSFEQLGDLCLKQIKKEKTFRITAQRVTKEYKNSLEIEKEIGAYIVDKIGLKVKLKEPEIEICIEIINGKAYVYSKPIKGLGGLPVGSSGTVYIEVKDKIKSTLVAFLMMKRGCAINLSIELPQINKFENGFKIKIRPVKDYDIIVKDETLNELTNSPDERFILRPLVGYTDKEIKEFYDKIKDM